MNHPHLGFFQNKKFIHAETQAQKTFTSKYSAVEFATLIFIRSRMILACPTIPWFPGILITTPLLFLKVLLGLQFCKLMTKKHMYILKN
jgi:hypothetical protein